MCSVLFLRPGYRLIRTQASLYARQWALRIWEENENVQLVKILPELKAVVTAAREREEMEQAMQD